MVEPLTEPTPAEREFIERLQAGELIPEQLLPEDAAISDRPRRHPALRWKAQNASAHRIGRRRPPDEAP